MFKKLEANSVYLKDESGLIGVCEGIFIPETSDEILSALNHVKDKGFSVKIQGSRTGICGAAVPQDDVIISTENYNKILRFYYNEEQSEATLRVQAGVTLLDINNFLLKKECSIDNFDRLSQDCYNNYLSSDIDLIFLPNPSEKSATIGGICATTAVGTTAHLYSNFYDNINSITVIDSGLRERVLSGEDLKKNDAMLENSGLFICEIVLNLYFDNPFKAGIVVKTKSSLVADSYTKMLSEKCKFNIFAAQYYDVNCLTFLKSHCNATSNLEGLSSIFENPMPFLWIEFRADDDDRLYELLEYSADIADELKVDESNILVAMSSSEISRYCDIKHLLTETSNALNSDTLLDFSLPTEDAVDFCDTISKFIENGYTACSVLSGDVTVRVIEGDCNKILNIAKSSGCGCSLVHGIGKRKKGLLKELSLELYNRIESEKRCFGEGMVSEG